MLIIPLPTFLLDFLLAISIMSGLLILLIVMFVPRSFDFSVFPSLLLITTVFGLALNVSSTGSSSSRGRPSTARSSGPSASSSWGATTSSASSSSSSSSWSSSSSSPRAPRGWPRSRRGSPWTRCPASRWHRRGSPTALITEDEARQATERDPARRPISTGPWTVPRSSSRATSRSASSSPSSTSSAASSSAWRCRGETFDVALKTYTLLTIGDGLVTQIPSLLITTATGIIVTRAVSKENLGTDLAKQSARSRGRSSSPPARSPGRRPHPRLPENLAYPARGRARRARLYPAQQTKEEEKAEGRRATRRRRP